MPSRPVYEVTVGSYSEGWEYTTIQGDVPDPGDPVHLADPLALTWGWDPLDYPGQLVPAQAQVALLVATAADLPAIAQGDRLYVHVDRPTAGTPIPWAHLDGVVTGDPELTRITGDRLLLSLIVVDPVAGLAERTISSRTDSYTVRAAVSTGSGWTLTDVYRPNTLTPNEVEYYDGEYAGVRLWRFLWEAGVNLAMDNTLYGVMPDRLGPITLDNAGVLDQVKRVLAAVAETTDTFVLRGVFTPYTDPFFTGPLNDAGNDVVTLGDESDDLTFFLMRLPRTGSLQTPLQIVKVGSVGTATPRAGRPSALAGGIVLDASSVPTPPLRWRKSRSAVTNQVKLVMLDDPASSEVSELGTYADLVARFGASTRTVTTQLSANVESTVWDISNPGVAYPPRDVANYLPDRAAAVPQWTTETLTIITSEWDDTDLDNYAGAFYPHPDPDGSTSLLRPFTVLDVTESLAVTGQEWIAGQMIGGVLRIAAGDLTIEATVRPEVPRTDVDPLTYAELAAHATLSSMAYAGGATNLDPTLTCIDFRLIGD